MQICANQIYQQQNCKCLPAFKANPKLKYSSIVRKADMQDLCRTLEYKIDISEETIESLVSTAKPKQIAFLTALIDKYNSMYCGLGNSLREKSEAVVNIYKKVQKPTMEHIQVVHSSVCNFADLEEIFSLAIDKKSLSFVHKIQKDILVGSKSSVSMIRELLKSQNKNKYIKNISDYESYIKMYCGSENAVSELNKMLADGSYSHLKYDKEYAVSMLMRNTYIKKAVGAKEDVITQEYTPERADFLEFLFEDYLCHKRTPDSCSSDDIILLYTSTTPKNISLRKRIMEAFKYSNSDSLGNNIEKQEIAMMIELFKKMDENDSFFKFVEKFFNKKISLASISELKEVIEAVPPKKGQLFIDNFSRIVVSTRGEERTEALKNELENPFFMSKAQKLALEEHTDYGFIEKDGFITKAKKYIKNKISQLRYSFMTENAVSEIEKSAIIPKSTDTTKFSIELPLNDVSAEHEEPLKVTLTNKFKETPKERKIRLSKEVNDYIKSMLSAKTYEKQNGVYTEKVTKMRLTLLPEIFASIKDSAKQARKEGKRANYDKRDAVKLYQLINGKNRKLVRYMLKQCDTNNNRLYNIKDIINFITKSENEVNLLKAVNIKFSPKSVKNYYENLFQEQVALHGKLKPARKKKAAKKPRIMNNQGQ